MSHTPPTVWSARLSAAALWALCAASAGYWGLRWGASPASAVLPPAVAPAVASAVDTTALGLKLGAPAAGPQTIAAPTSSLRLMGVVAQGASGSAGGAGSAIIALEGQPARAYRVGDAVTDGLVLVAVQRNRAMLAPSMQAPVQTTLELPEPAER